MDIPASNFVSNDYNNIGLFSNWRGKGRYHIDYNKCWAHIVTPESMPELHALFKKCTDELISGKPPQLIIYETANNRYHASYHMTENVIVMSRSLVEAMSPDTVTVIAAHETGHHRTSRRNFLKQTAALFCGLGAAALYERSENSRRIEQKKEELAAQGQDTEHVKVPFDRGIAFKQTMLFVAVMHMVQMAALRSEEYAADRASVDVVKDPGLVKNALCEALDINPDSYFNRNKDMVDKVLAACHVFFPHPTMDRRVQAAERHAAEKGYTVER